MTLRISCTTCRARLKVVDPSAVGQIIACPKCGSMVQVIAPPGWTPDAPENEIGGGTLTATATQSAGAQAAVAELPAEHPATSQSGWFWPAMAGVTLVGLMVIGWVIVRERARRAANEETIALTTPSETTGAPEAAPTAPNTTPPAADPPGRKALRRLSRSRPRGRIQFP